jgi:hypothetical protein
MPDFTEVTPGEKKAPTIGPKAYKDMTEAEKQTKMLKNINGKLNFFVFLTLLSMFFAFLGMISAF